MNVSFCTKEFLDTKFLIPELVSIQRKPITYNVLVLYLNIIQIIFINIADKPTFDCKQRPNSIRHEVEIYVSIKKINFGYRFERHLKYSLCEVFVLGLFSSNIEICKRK